MEERVQEKIEIHYYFDDNSHTMNAFIRNKAEKDLLDALNRVGAIYNTELMLETEAYQEGGLVEIILASFSFSAIAMYFKPTINDTFTHYLTRDEELERLQKEKLQAEIKSQNLDNQKNEIELKVLEDREIARCVSKFYKKIDGYDKVKKLGFTNITTNGKEYIVEKHNFKNFILKDETDIIEDEDANIEIISPILKEERYKWRGLYNGNIIDFSMGDSGFKEEVINGKQIFSNGSLISCKLQITITYDEFGEEKRKSYSVKEVYGKQETPLSEMKLRNSGIKRKKQKWEDEHQSDMFDFIDKLDDKKE